MIRAKILSYKERNLDTEGHTATIHNALSLLNILRQTPGDSDKPVRILIDQNSNSVLVAKFGLSEDSNRLLTIEDELSNLRNFPKNIPHIANLLWGSYAKEKDGKNSLVCCMEYVAPFEKIHTLRDLSCETNVLNFKHAIFQAIFTMLYFQTLFPGFRHNDLKADNVLITSSLKQSVRYCNNNKYWHLKDNAVWVKIIDFELSCTPDGNRINSRLIQSNDTDMQNSFGLSSEQCTSFDIHLLFYDCLMSSSSAIRQDFESFIYDFIPSKFFKKENLTSQCRLRLEDQKTLDFPNLLSEMLNHQYFCEFQDSVCKDCDITVH